MIDLCCRLPRENVSLPLLTKLLFSLKIVSARIIQNAFSRRYVHSLLEINLFCYITKPFSGGLSQILERLYIHLRLLPPRPAFFSEQTRSFSQMEDWRLV